MYDTIVLPGGGIKGFYILGGIQAAMDRGLLDNVTNFVGTSVGSMICYLLAIGYTPTEIVVALHLGKWLEEMKQFNLSGMIDWSGALSFTPIQEILEKMTINKIGKLITLGKLKEEFKKTLICTTFNVTQYKTEYLGPDNYPDLPCLTALRMSSSIPLIFERYKYMNNYYIDGGVADNLPLKKAEELSELSQISGISQPSESRVFAIHLRNKEWVDDNILSYFLKILQIPINNFVNESIRNKKDFTDVFDINNASIKNIVNFNLKSKEKLDMFSDGYDNVATQLKERERERKEKLNAEIADKVIEDVVTHAVNDIISEIVEEAEKEEIQNSIKCNIETKNEISNEEEVKEKNKNGNDDETERTNPSGGSEICTGQTG